MRSGGSRPTLVKGAAAGGARELPESRTRQLEQVIEQSGESIVVKDLNGVVTMWNREATALYGFTAEEAIGKPLRALHAADLSEAEYAKVLERIRAGKPTSRVVDRRKKNGEIVRVSNRTTPLTDPNGRLIGEITIARDVTALHRTEEALRAAQATLEAKLKSLREANRSLAREIAARRETEHALREANQTLESTVRQLEQFNRDDEALVRMAELLQSCSERTEAYAVVRETAGRLFAGLEGSLHIYRESRDVLEHAASWGEAAPEAPAFAPGDCWALRLGRPHAVEAKSAVRCRHVPDGIESYVCMPVQGEGQVLGLLNVALGAGGKGADRRLRALVDRVGPALANLKLRESLRVLALHDPLTGLYNRRFLEDALKREIQRFERTRKPLSLIMIDVDHFKRFNDTFGHDAGDFVLNAVAQVIARSVRGTDIPCRYGGEELAVLLPESDLGCALERAELLRKQMRETSLSHRGRTLPPPTASFGVSEYPRHGENVDDFLKAADRALYRAKQEGRDRVRAAEPGKDA
jgi:diguanylate cyclase (GGDEF)-like protein/PAS domain S-box-containing protein